MTTPYPLGWARDAEPARQPDNPHHRWVSQLVADPARLPVSILWAPPTFVLNQGRVSSCVGNAGSGTLAGDPVRDPGIDDPYALALYYACQADEGRVQDDNAGTTLQALAHVLIGRGRVGGYGWSRTAPEVRDFILGQSPMVMATPWRQSMYTPAPDGLVTVDPASPQDGYHATYWYGFDGTQGVQGRFVCRNSWGSGWGHGGDFLVDYADLALGKLGSPGGEWQGLAFVELAATWVDPPTPNPPPQGCLPGAQAAARVAGRLRRRR